MSLKMVWCAVSVRDEQDEKKVMGAMRIARDIRTGV